MLQLFLNNKTLGFFANANFVTIKTCNVIYYVNKKQTNKDKKFYLATVYKQEN